MCDHVDSSPPPPKLSTGYMDCPLGNTMCIVLISNFFQNFYLKEVKRRVLLSFVKFPKVSERYSVDEKSYLTLTNKCII